MRFATRLVCVKEIKFGKKIVKALDGKANKR